MGNKKVITCVIPARLKSTRLPNKILADLGGKTLLERVWNRAKSSRKFDRVIFAIDSKEAENAIEAFNGEYVMTDPACPTGTHRLIELVKISRVVSDIWVNWQVDEPFITDQMIDDLLQGVNKQSDLGIWTLKKSLAPNELTNPNVTKVITDVTGKAIFFSRLPIPYYRDGRKDEQEIAYKHIGIYAYSDPVLKQIAKLPESPLASAEMLEQLAYLEHSLPIQVYTTHCETLGIDTQADLDLAIQRIRQCVLVNGP